MSPLLFEAHQVDEALAFRIEYVLDSADLSGPFVHFRFAAQVPLEQK